MTALETRMSLHHEGQITWPEPELGKHCDTCAHFYTPPNALEGKGICALVEAHQNVVGKRFIGADAVACPKWKVRDGR
jgi:hypothetical protein